MLKIGITLLIYFILVVVFALIASIILDRKQ
jgi:hypothetical protein